MSLEQQIEALNKNLAAVIPLLAKALTPVIMAVPAPPDPVPQPEPTKPAKPARASKGAATTVAPVVQPSTASTEAPAKPLTTDDAREALVKYQKAKNSAELARKFLKEKTGAETLGSLTQENIKKLIDAVNTALSSEPTKPAEDDLSFLN